MIATHIPRSSRWTALARNKVVIGAVGIAAVGAAVTGTLSVFTATGTRSQTVTAGTLVFNLVDPTVAVAFTTPISGMAAGDTADRTINVANPAGDLNYFSIGLVASATATSLLNTDATNGLQVSINRCTVAWTQTAGAAAVCTGTSAALTASEPLANLITTPVNYTTATTPLLSSLTNGGTDYLMFHYLLPTSATTAMGGLTSTILYTFTATQAAATTH